MSANGRESASEIIAERAAREAHHAHDRLDDLRERLDWHAGQLGAQIAAVEETARDRGHRLADALVVLTAEVADLRHAQRSTLDELRALRGDLALTRAKAHEAVAEARASRPDDGRLTEIAARVLETAADGQRVAVERARDSIFARRERRAAILRWVGQAVGWLTVGGGIVAALQQC